MDRGHEWLSVVRQCALLGVSRSGVYRRGGGDQRQLLLPVLLPARCLKEYVTEAELLPHADVTEIRIVAS